MNIYLFILGIVSLPLLFNIDSGFGQSSTNTTTSTTDSNNNNNNDGTAIGLDAASGGTIATVGGGLASGIIATFLKSKQKDEKIDAALKAKDRLIDDIYDCLFLIVNAALEPANKGKPFDDIINQKAYPDNKVDTQTIGNVINERRAAFKQWYRDRYLENPE